MTRRAKLTAEELRYWLDYNPSTGFFTWRNNYHKSRVGERAGYDDGHGYIGIRVGGACHAAHRLAWLWMTGEWPNPEIDHRNSVRTDNRWCNLREATRGQNSVNMATPRSHSKSRIKGVWWDKYRLKWRSVIRVSKKTIILGYFDDAEAARAAYNAASAKMHGEFGRPA